MGSSEIIATFFHEDLDGDRARLNVYQHADGEIRAVLATFGGRIGEQVYIDMDASALVKLTRILESINVAPPGASLAAIDEARAALARETSLGICSNNLAALLKL
jgi:hypothetical protein